MPSLSEIGASVIQSPINFSGAGDNVVIAGALGQTIKVLQFFFVIAAATNLTFKSGTTPLTGLMDYSSVGAQVQDFIQLQLTCNRSDSFIINSLNAVQIGGTIWYVLS